MPRTRRTPSYQHHKPSGQAFAEFGGFRLYLGKHDSAESWAEYHRACAEWLAGRVITSSRTDTRVKLTAVDDLVIAFTEWANARYVKNGEPTTEPRLFRVALEPVLRLYGLTAAADFGPLALVACRNELIAAGHCRSKVNSYVGRIKRVWKWGVSRELVPESAWRALSSVEGLRAWQSSAPETEPVMPVPDKLLKDTLKVLSPTLRAMVELQLATGMRPGEVCALRTCDVDRKGAVWKYSPASHKTEHHGRQRVIFIGPTGRAALAPWLRDDAPDVPVFSPKASREWYIAKRAAERKSKRPPSQLNRKRKAHPKRFPGDRFRAGSYGRAIKTACRRGKLEEWSPGQLRHNAATKIRAEFGIEATRVILGHASAVTSEVYALADFARAEQIMGNIG